MKCEDCEGTGHFIIYVPDKGYGGKEYFDVIHCGTCKGKGEIEEPTKS